MSDRNGFGSFLIGFIVGGITGAIVALLYAPKSGEETRAVIKEKAIELADITTETVEETYGKAEKAATDAVEKAQELIKQAQAKASEVAAKGQVVLEETKVKVTSKPQKPADEAEA